jgi:arylformamidase
LTAIVDLSPTVADGFRGPPSTDVGVRLEAEWLVTGMPRCVGCDFFEEPAARDPGWEAPEFVVHRALLGAGIPLVEGLVGLEKLPVRCEFFAPFFKFGGIEAAPARAFAIVPEGGS